ncbi:hypothetical protein, conserved [Eimeria tenella]|uniref:Transmembrane protein n=1 Tax=Eimeria tenella TaxID=5802 RepID=U6KXM2_EIMTE|nr:hypothetical protein, conserved [Eimeria tenella]CDJ41069.1 hypothetical protein, conserved [Eimeria tenella]|eukprot:XP_013231819.1 hypothetical protein, conserved [Eimeria tenella]
MDRDRRSVYAETDFRSYTGSGNNYFLLDGQDEEENPQMPELRLSRREFRMRHRKSTAGSRGLNKSVSEPTMRAWIAGFLLLSLALSISVASLNRSEEKQQKQQQNTLPAHEPDVRVPSSPSYSASAAYGAGGDAELKQEKLPMTRNLHRTFLSLSLTEDNGLLRTLQGPEWGPAKEALLRSVDLVLECQPDEFEDTDSKVETMRLMLAMDLACLENAAVETKLAVDNARASQSDNHSEDIAAKIKANIDARRKQSRAAELWEVEVLKGKLGSDPELKAALVKLLLAVRSRAASSEYLSATVGTVMLQSDPSPHSKAEENRAYEETTQTIETASCRSFSVNCKESQAGNGW